MKVVNLETIIDTRVVQDLATQWIQSYPCKTKTSQETQRSLQKFLEPNVIYTDNSLEFGKACEDLSWNHCRSTPHRSETNGLAERAVRRVKEGASAVLLQSSITLQLRKTIQESINLERKSYLDCSSDTLSTRGRVWNGDTLVADIEELETMDASEIYSKRLNAKEVIFPK